VTKSPGAELRSVRNAALLLSAALVLGLTALTGLVTALDRQVGAVVRLTRAGWLDGLCRLVDASVLPAVGAGVVTCAALLVRRRRGYLVPRMLAVTLGGWVLAVAVRPVLDRPRPPRAWWLTEVGEGSYPSTHVALVSGLALAAYAVAGRTRYRTPVVALGPAAVLAVALAQLCLGAHYLTDVLGALLLSGAVAALANSLPSSPPASREPYRMRPSA
jgi:membrane-associated phospholipid phosphatase